MPRKTDWIDSRIGLTVASASTDFVEVDGGSTQVVQRGTTVIRTIVDLYLQSSTVAGAWGTQVLDCGIGMSTREAFTAGILPDPGAVGDDPIRGWIYRGSSLVSQNGVGGVVVFRLTADIRGARMIDNGKVWLKCDSSPIAGTAFTTFVRGLIRVLVKLP